MCDGFSVQGIRRAEDGKPGLALVLWERGITTDNPLGREPNTIVVMFSPEGMAELAKVAAEASSFR